MIDYVLLAEFDINAGSIIRYQHPINVQGVSGETIAAYMLPEGGHNRSADSTYFVLNRKKTKDLLVEQQKMITDPNSTLIRFLTQDRLEALKHLSQKHIDIKLFQINDMNWRSFYADQDQRQLFLKISLKGENDFSVQVFEQAQNQTQILEIKAHAFLNYTWYGNMKFSVQTLKGTIFGIEVVKPEQVQRDELEKALKFSPYKMIEDDLNHNSQTIYFLSIMKNRLDEKAKRGAVVKALAIGSKRKMVEQFKGILNKAIDTIFDMDDANSKENSFNKIKEFIAKLYDSLNLKDLRELVPHSDFIQKRVYKDINKNFSSTAQDQSLYRHYDLNFNKQNTKIVIPQAPFPDEMATTSIKKFIMKFGDRCMLIYDAILSEKKILFSGGLDFSADEIQEYVFACAAIVSPPLIGILQKLHPYAALSNLDFLEEPGYIAGVTNPMFKQRVNWYDLCCEIDIGKLKVSRNDGFYEYSEQRYYQFDMDFIRPIIQRVRQNSINDEEIKRAFESYTMFVIDEALREKNLRTEELMHDNDRIIDLLHFRIQRFQRTNLYKVQVFLSKIREFDMKENLAFSQIERVIRRLRICREISDHETLTIFQQINKYLQDYDSVVKLLYLLPKSRDGLILIAQGLFSISEEVQRLSTNIIRKIETTDVGKHQVSTLNYYFMLKYQANLSQNIKIPQ